MPYSGVDDPKLPSNVKKMPAKKKKAWIATWNNVYETCTKDGGDRLSCEKKAFQIANGNAKKQQQRAWSGAASNYKSTEAYCSACLIDLNSGSGEKTQENCKLPVKAPGSNSYDKDGVHAAAVRFGSIKKPSGVSDTTWSAAVKSAANKLISAYNSFDEAAPDSIYEAAGKKPPAKKKQTTELSMQTRSVFRRIFDGFLDSLGVSEDLDRYELDLPVKQAMGMDRIYQQLYAQLREQSDWTYPMSLYYDNGNIFCTVAQSGNIYKVPLTISNDEVTMGDWQRVEEAFSPVVEQSFRVRRQKDGTYRWIAIAGTTILNRVGEIDSSELFDSFVEHAARTGEYPRLDFYHLGLENPEMWEFGTADYLAREGVCYIASGTFDESHPLAQATIRACEKGDLEWGNSVEFYASAKEELISVEPEIKIPVYKRGRNSRISLVLEEDAAGLFTQYSVSLEGVTRTMDAKTREKLTALYGSDTEGLQAFLDKFEAEVDGVNRTVKDKNLIHRSAKDENEKEVTRAEAASEEADEDGAEDEDAEGEENEIVLDAETMTAIADQVVQSNEIKLLTQSINELKTMVGELLVAREKDQAEITKLRKSVGDLSKEETEKKQEYLQDLPRNKRTHITHRPREMHMDVDGDESMDSIAGRTLNGIPSASRY